MLQHELACLRSRSFGDGIPVRTTRLRGAGRGAWARGRARRGQGWVRGRVAREGGRAGLRGGRGGRVAAVLRGGWRPRGVPRGRRGTHRSAGGAASPGHRDLVGRLQKRADLSRAPRLERRQQARWHAVMPCRAMPWPLASRRAMILGDLLSAPAPAAAPRTPSRSGPSRPGPPSATPTRRRSPASRSLVAMTVVISSSSRRFFLARLLSPSVCLKARAPERPPRACVTPASASRAKKADSCGVHRPASCAAPIAAISFFRPALTVSSPCPLMRRSRSPRAMVRTAQSQPGNSGCAKAPMPPDRLPRSPASESGLGAN